MMASVQAWGHWFTRLRASGADTLSRTKWSRWFIIASRWPATAVCSKNSKKHFFARAKACMAGGVAREFVEFQYRTRESWRRARRVIGKAEVLHEENNPRFMVTNLPRKGFQTDAPERFARCKCYEEFYCPLGNMENEIKEQLLDLHADRTSTHFMASNQLRLCLSSFACLLLERLRTLTLPNTVLERATASTIQLRPPNSKMTLWCTRRSTAAMAVMVLEDALPFG